jgi:hypothetical protein
LDLFLSCDDIQKMVDRQIGYEIVVGRERAAKKIMVRTTVGGRQKQKWTEIRVQLERRRAWKRWDASEVCAGQRPGGRRTERAGHDSADSTGQLPRPNRWECADDDESGM